MNHLTDGSHASAANSLCPLRPPHSEGALGAEKTGTQKRVLETIYNHWQLLAGLLAINLVFLGVGIGWPRRESDIRTHSQWPEVRVLVDRYIAIALPESAQDGAPFARPDAAARDEAANDTAGFYNRPAAYVAPDADDAEWMPVPAQPDPPAPEPPSAAPNVRPALDGLDHEAGDEEFDPNQIAFAFAEVGADARTGRRNGAPPPSAAEAEPAPVTFLEWFAARERHRLDAEVSANAGKPRR